MMSTRCASHKMSGRKMCGSDDDVSMVSFGFVASVDLDG